VDKNLDGMAQSHYVLVMFLFELLRHTLNRALPAALVDLSRAAAHLSIALAEFEKAAPNDPAHPGWPAGAPDSQGGKFKPKDEDGVDVAGDVW
jgi:hypothetical protein